MSRDEVGNSRLRGGSGVPGPCPSTRDFPVTGPYGTSRVTYSGYDYAAANAAQRSASIENERMISAAVENGRQNLDVLEQGVIKDNTMFPGEWYGGQVHFDEAKGEPPKAYQMTIQVGEDQHVVNFSQSRS